MIVCKVFLNGKLKIKINSIVTASSLLVFPFFNGSHRLYFENIAKPNNEDIIKTSQRPTKLIYEALLNK